VSVARGVLATRRECGGSSCTLYLGLAMLVSCRRIAWSDSLSLSLSYAFLLSDHPLTLCNGERLFHVKHHGVISSNKQRVLLALAYKGACVQVHVSVRAPDPLSVILGILVLSKSHLV